MSDQIKELKLQLQKDPKSKVFSKLAEAYRKQGEYELAISTAKDGLKHNKDFFPGLLSLARSLFEYGEWDEASEILVNCLRFSPDNVIALKQLSKIYFDQNRKDQAKPLLEKLIDLGEQDDWVTQSLQSIDQVWQGGVSQDHTQAINEDFDDKENDFNDQPSSSNIEVNEVASKTLAQMYLAQGHSKEAMKMMQKLENPVKDATVNVLQAFLTRIEQRRRRDIGR